MDIEKIVNILYKEAARALYNVLATSLFYLFARSPEKVGMDWIP